MDTLARRLRSPALLIVIATFALALLAPARADAQTATLTAPANGSTILNNAPVTFSWGAVTGALTYYLYVGTTAGAKDVIDSGEVAVTSIVHAALPVGTYYVTLYTKSAGPTWNHSSSTFTVATPPTATLTAPANGSTILNNAPVTFSWGAVAGAQTYYLYVGTSAGANNTVNSGEIAATSVVSAALPVGTYYVTLYTKSAGPTWTHSSSTFTVTAPPTATLSAPANGATVLSTAPITFTWGAVTGAQAYYLYVGTTAGASNTVNSGEISATSLVSAALPAGTYYVTLYTKSAGPTWTHSSSTFTVTAPPTATLSAPANGATVLSTSPVTFTWGTVTGAQAYYLYVGTTAGASNIVNSGEISATSLVSAALPVGTYYVTLYTKSAGPTWTHSSSTFTVAAPPTATLSAPANGATVCSNASVTFSWGAVTGAQTYYLYVGTTAGANNIINSGETTATSIVHAALAVGTYYVTLYTKSAGPTWTHTSSTFIVAVQCGGGGGGFWLPYVVTPGTGGAGSNGLGVVPSTLASSTLQFVTSNPVNQAGVVLTLNSSGGVLNNYSPYAVVYTQEDGSNNWHLYSAQLHDGSTTPTPVQVSSLSLPNGAYAFDSSCFSQIYLNAFDPTSTFFIIEEPTAQACGSGTAGNSFVLVRLTDSPATAPTSLPAAFSTANISPMYNSAGVLTGLVLVDAGGHLDFYAASGYPGFTSAPTVIASGVTDKSKLTIYTDRAGNVLSGGTVGFFVVVNGSGKDVLYRVTNTGSSALVYTAAGAIDGGTGLGGNSAWDNTNVYFYDASGSAPTTFAFKKVPIAGTTVTTLYTDSSGTVPSYSIVDSDGSYLIIQASNPSTFTYTLKTLSLAAVPPVTPATLVGYSGVGTILQPFLDYASDHLFVDVFSAVAVPNAQVFTPSSSTPIAGQGGSGTVFAQFTLGLHGVSTAGTVLQYTGVTAMGFTNAGGSLFAMNPATFAASQIKNQSDASNYVVPASSHVIVVPLSPTIGEGGVFSSTGANTNGLALDVSSDRIVTITQANSDVNPL